MEEQTQIITEVDKPLKLKKKKKTSKNKDPNVDDFKHAKKGVRKHVQKFGSFMAGMIMPSVSILIAWGLLAAFFLTKYDENGNYVESLGWIKSEWVGNSLGRMIAPMMKYLIPTLIAFIAGKMVYDIRGGMMGAFVVMAAIIGNDWLYRDDVMGTILQLNGVDVIKIGAPNQIVAALMLAPLFSWLFKLIEKTYINKIKAGFEMLTKNFGLALYAIVFGIAVFFGWGFVMYGISFVMTAIINLFTKANWAFPFMAIFTEPLRALFLNNALNYGVMVPLGTQDIQINHKIASWYFMVGGNPGPGFGLLIAYVCWRKQQRASAAGASLIQLVGGIHEVHYVYILAEPIMILSTIGGAATSLAIVAIFDGGTASVISPGSIISVIAMSPGAKYIAVNVSAVFAGALVSFGIASLIMVFKKKGSDENVDIELTDEGIKFNESPDKKATLDVTKPEVEQTKDNFNWKDVKQIMVACDAGMGSSAMAAGIIRKYVKDHNLEVDVKNTAVKDLTEEPDIIVTLITFKDIAREHNKHALIYPITKFLGSGIYDDLFKQLEENLPKKVEDEKKEKK